MGERIYWGLWCETENGWTSEITFTGSSDCGYGYQPEHDGKDCT